MKIVTSPAKLMNIENKSDLLRATSPKFIDDAAHIQKYLKEKITKISIRFDGDFVKISR